MASGVFLFSRVSRCPCLANGSCSQLIYLREWSFGVFSSLLVWASKLTLDSHANKRFSRCIRFGAQF